MRDIGTVFGFTFREGMRKKAFIFSTVIVLLVILGACLIARAIGAPSASGAEPPGTAPAEVEKSKTCYVIDAGEVVPGAIPALADRLPHIDFVAGDEDKQDEYIDEVATDGQVAAVIISMQKDAEGADYLHLVFYVTDFMTGMPSDEITATVKTVYITDALQGVDSGLVAQALIETAQEIQIAGNMDFAGYTLGIVMVMLMFFAVYYYGYFVAMSVASEKTSRVMETLVVSAKPSHILIGKCLAMGLLGLLQLALFLLVGALGYTYVVPDGFLIMGMALDLSAFTIQSGLLVLVYFVLGYTLYAMVNSVCGATVSRAEDVNSALMPAILISMISFFSAYTVMFLPDGPAKRAVTYIPFTSPFIMPFRLLNERMNAMDIGISVGLLLVAIVIVSFISIRLYAASVLHYGQRLKLKDLLSLKT